MGNSTYFGPQVASVPHLERGDEVARDLRADVDAAFVLLEADLAGIVGGLPQGNLIVGNASNKPADLVAKTTGYILVGNGTTVASVAMTGVCTIAAGGGTTFVQSSYGEQKAAYTAKLYWNTTGADGTVGTHDFLNATVAASIPDNAVITNVRLDCVTAVQCALGGGTISIGFETATDVKGVTAFDAAPFNGTLSLEAVAIKLTAARPLRATVAGNPLTGGKIVALVEYFVTE